MVNNVSALKMLNLGRPEGVQVSHATLPNQAAHQNSNPIKASAVHLNNINTSLSQADMPYYTQLVTLLAGESPINQETGALTYQQKLEALLRNGKLLDNTSNDRSTTLQNLYNIASRPRVDGFDNKKILKLTIDTLYDPTIITQKFGDVPKNLQDIILSSPKADAFIQEKLNLANAVNPGTPKTKEDILNVKENGSSTCPAASIEFHMANKRPAEFSRWVEGLTSPNASVVQNIKLDSISKNPINSMWLLRTFKVPVNSMNFKEASLTLKPDANAYLRANIQDKNWDPGERSILDVLMQSTIMQCASQQNYDSLTDIRGGVFNYDPQGLIEMEKTFAESIIENKEKLSIVYQNIQQNKDEKQILQGYRCGFDKMAKHIIDTINSGGDVIVGYVVTDKEGGITPGQEIIMGHEITIVNYQLDKNNRLHFIYNDTDDDVSTLKSYPADWLLPRLHHAGYPAHIVENEKELLDVPQISAA
jgi:hypothetical protein